MSEKVQVGEVFIKIGAIMDGFNKAIFEAKQKTSGLGLEFDKASAKMESLSKNLASAGKKMSLALTLPIVGIGMFAVSSMAKMEMLETGFMTMLGSAEKAKKMMSDLSTFASATPFQLEGLARGTQNLLSAQVAEEQLIDTMRMLGDTAQGSQEKLDSLVSAYGKVQLKGKASMEELNMIAERGIPIYKTLQDQLGVSEAKFFKMLSAGKISSSEITKAFKTMTSEGGVFFNGMKNSSLTFLGLWSTLTDDIVLLLAEMAGEFKDTLKSIVETFSLWVKSFKELDKETKSLIAKIVIFLALLGPSLIIVSKLITAYKAMAMVMGAVKLALAGQALMAGASTGALIVHKAVLIAVTLATKLWNLALSMNPLVIVGMLVLGLVVGLTSLAHAQDESTKSAGEQADALKRVGTEAEETKSKVDSYLGSLTGTHAQKMKKINDDLFASQMKEMEVTDEVSKNKERAFRKELEDKRISLDKQFKEEQKFKGKQKAEADVQAKKTKTEEEIENRKKAMEKWGEYNEKFGRNEFELYKLHNAELQNELQEAYDKKLIDEKTYREARAGLIVEAMEKEAEEEKKANEKRREQVFYGLSSLGNMAGQISNLVSMHSQNQQAEIENRTSAQLMAINTQFEAEKQAIENSALTEAEKNERLKALDEKRARDEKAINDKATADKRKVQRDSAKLQKQLSIFETMVSIPQAAFQAFASAQILPPPLNAIVGGLMASMATAFGMAKLALIQQQPLPMASGGLVTGSTFAQIGEGADDEAVMPLNSKVYSRMAKGLLIELEKKFEDERTAGQVITDNKSKNPVHVTVNLGSKTLYDEITEATDNGEIRINARSIV